MTHYRQTLNSWESWDVFDSIMYIRTKILKDQSQIVAHSCKSRKKTTIKSKQCRLKLDFARIKYLKNLKQ